MFHRRLDITVLDDRSQFVVGESEERHVIIWISEYQETVLLKPSGDDTSACPVETLLLSY
jgi:hypothetical protein